MIKDNKMKFKVIENGNLTIKDDKKETVIYSDRYNLIDLMKTIQSFLLGETSEKNIEKAKAETYVYRYNPRSKRHEKVFIE